MEEYFIEKRTTFDVVMDVLVFIAVFVVTIYLLLDFVIKMNYFNVNWNSIIKSYVYIDWAVFIIFSIDLWRLWKKANGFKDFLKHSWLDILATIPFGLISSPGTFFNLFKISRTEKILKIMRAQKVSKIGKEFKAAAHLKDESEEYKRKHRL